MKSLITLLAVFLSFNVLATCEMPFAQANTCAKIEWIDGPHLDVKSHFQLTFWEMGDASETPVTPSFDVKVYSWMTMANGHNHGGPAMTLENIGDGLYEVRDARFFMHGMKGFWEVRVELKENRNVISLGKHRVKLPSHD